MNKKERTEYAKSRLDGLREILKNAPNFECMCCQGTKPKGEAAGAHLYEPNNDILRKAMLDEKGQERVGTYVLCLECVDSYPEDIIHQRVTTNFGKAGLFGPPKE